MMEEVLIITDHVWEDTINVVFTDDIKRSITEQCGRLNIPSKRYTKGLKHTDGVVCNVKEKNYRGTWVLFNFKHCNEGIILHECNHVTFGLLDKRKIYLNERTQEVYVYTQQWLFNQINKFYKHLKSEQATEQLKEVKED
jgi:hypothetical protein